jgi:micrococcal nuclease
MTYIDILHNIQEADLVVSRVLDGDSISVIGIYTHEEKEIRLYGLDAPETRNGRKLREDEEKARVAGEMLRFMGNQAKEFVMRICPPGTPVTIYTEPGNETDFWGRQLAYVILPDGLCLNDLLIQEGYAKATSEYYCKELPRYQVMNWDAKLEKRGLYGLTEIF